MKNKFTTLLAFLLFATTAFAQTNLLTGSVGNYGLAPQTGIACTLTLVSPNPRTVNGIFIRRDPVVATSDASGAFYFTNVVWGNYTLTFAGRVDTVFKLVVLTNTEGTVPLASLATSATVAMPNPATNFYTMSQVDALVAGAGGGGGGATWTNGHDSVVLIAGERGVSGDAIESVFAGYQTGSYATNATTDVFIGTGAGRYAADATGSTFIGAYAGRNATNNTDSVFIGKYAGENVTRPNTFIVSGTAADVGTNALIYGEFDTGLLRVNGNLNVTGTATGPDATTTNGFVTLQQLASSIGSTHTMWASTNTGFLAGYYNALMEPPTHPAATITVAGVTNGQILAQWTSDTNMASVIRAGIGSIASRQRITSTSGNHALTVMPAFYIRHANASETAIDSAQSIPLSDVLTDYNTEFMISSNMNVLATDRMVVRWVATSVGNTPTWEFECGSTVYGIVVNFPVVTAMTGGYLTNGDTRDITFAGAVYGQNATSTNGFTTLAQLNSATNLLTGPSPSNSNLLYAARYATSATNTAQSIPWAPLTNSSSGWGSSATNIEWLSTGTRFRIRQSTPVSQARFLYVSSPLLNTNLSELRFKIWRTNTTAAGTFTLIDTSADVKAQVTASGTNTVTFTPPLNCQVGDYVGVFASWTNANYNPFRIDTRGFYSSGTWIKNDGAGFTGSKQWSTEAYLTNLVPLVELYATNSPVVVFLGDSIIGNLQADTAASNIIPDIVSTNLGLVWQNMGVGGQQVQEFTARVTNDVFNAHPNMIILEGGVNNLIAGNANATIQGYFDALWTTISNRSIPFVQCAIFPTSGWVDATNRALLNNWISNNVASYGGVYWDAAPYIGSNSPTGPAGNLWYPLPGTTIDNLHFNANGCWIIGTNLVNFINSLTPVSTGTLATRTELIAVSNALANAASPNALTNNDTRSITFANNLTISGTITGNGNGITNTSGYSVSRMADTNWVLAQIASLGAHVYATGVTNTQGVLTLTNKSQGWSSVPTTVTTNTVSAAAGQYVRSVVSTNTFSRFEAGPISIEAYVFRVGAVATSVSFHPEIYIYDPILSNLVEVAAAPSQTCQSNVPMLFDFSVSLPSSFVPTNASHIVWAWKIDSTNGTPTSLNFVSGGTYDSHLSFSVPAASGFVLPSTVPLTNIDNAFYGSNTFNGITYFKEIRSAYPGGNIGIGSNAAQVASAGLVNVAVGANSLSKNTNGSYNVAIGSSALQNATNVSSTVAIGYGSQASLQTGTLNTAVGYGAQLSLISGIDNTSLGYLSQYKLTTGNYNTAAGSGSQTLLTTGQYNSAFGDYVQAALVGGSENSAFGYRSQFKLTSGVGNIAFGMQSQYLLTTGIGNIGMGSYSQFDTTGGSFNTAVGYSSQNRLVSGTNNVSVGAYSSPFSTNTMGVVALGYKSGSGATIADNASSVVDVDSTFIGTSSGRSSTIPNTTPLTNATAIGYNAKAIANNTVTLGGTGKEAVALVLNPMSVQPTNIAIGNPYIYSRTNASVAELFAVGGDGVETQISPHADDAPPQLYDRATGDMKEIIWRESNPYITNGLVSFINLRRMARTMELQTRVLLLLGGVTNASTTAAMARLKAMTVAEKQVLMTEDYPAYNARTGNNLQPLDWDTIQNGVQATYDMQRANVDLQRTYLSATNAVIQAQIDAGDTNVTLVALPDALPVRDVRQAKPGWMK